MSSNDAWQFGVIVAHVHSIVEVVVIILVTLIVWALLTKTHGVGNISIIIII